jgi:LuxR family transcriptional activator of conjugal transfer of Ti plasmids
MQAAGYEAFAYIEVLGHEVKILTNYHPEYQALYAERNFREIDPVMISARRNRAVFHWSLDDLVMRGLSRELRRFRSAALHFGLRSGVTISSEGTMGSFIMLTFATASPETIAPAKWDPLLSNRSLVGIRYALRNLGEHPMPQSGRRLSPRESQCLAWQAKGLKTHETAIVMKISARTVQYYLDNIREKLHAETIAHAVAIAKDMHLL